MFFQYLKHFRNFILDKTGHKSQHNETSVSKNLKSSNKKFTKE